MIHLLVSSYVISHDCCCSFDSSDDDDDDDEVLWSQFWNWMSAIIRVESSHLSSSLQFTEELMIFKEFGKRIHHHHHHLLILLSCSEGCDKYLRGGNKYIGLFLVAHLSWSIIIPERSWKKLGHEASSLCCNSAGNRRFWWSSLKGFCHGVCLCFASQAQACTSII